MKLGRHSVKLGRHSVKLGRHSVKLGRHSVKLGRHSVKLGRHSVKLGRHSVKLGRHSVKLGRHSCSVLHSPHSHRLVGLVVRHPPRERKVPGSNPACAGIIFQGQVIPVTQKLALQCLPCQAPGVIGSALGLVGPVSVYCDWVR